MNKTNLYEKLPLNLFPLNVLEFDSFPKDFTLHWHEHTEILLIKEGNLRLRCGDKIINAQKGECIIINGNELHEGITGKCNFICVYLSPTLFEEEHYLFDNLINDGFVSDIINKIVAEHKGEEYVNSVLIKGYTYILIAHLIKNYTQKTLTEIRYKQHSKKSQTINDAVKYIEQNYCEDISTEYLAKISYLSEGYFCHVFKEVTGKTVNDYIATLRIAKAIDLIKNTDMSITEISQQCGYTDSNYFSRIFRKYKNTSPSSLR